MDRLAGSALGITPTTESEVEERKESWQESALHALAALANTRGGTLWIGIKDSGEPAEPNGWLDAGTPGKMEAISSQIIDKLGIHPSSMTVETVHGKPALAIVVPRAFTPVFLDGHYWRRVGNTSRKVASEELTRILLERTGGHWDELPCSLSLDSLDAEAFSLFFGLAQARLPGMRRSDTPEMILRNLNLIDADGNLVRGAVLLFGRDREPQRLCSNGFVQVGRFRGDGATIVDDKSVYGNLFAQLEGTLAILKGWLQVSYEIPAALEGQVGLDSVRRKEIWEYPLTALREAVANALIHRDYTRSGRVMVRVYDDRLVISSPGSLPEGMSIHELTRDPHGSILRNPRLAEGFFFAEIVERWGSGTIRMARECEAQGLPAPAFELSGHELWVTFRKEPFTDEGLRQMGLSGRQVKAVKFVMAHGRITNAQYQLEASVGARTATRDLASLVAKGVLEQKGEVGKGTHYVIVKPQMRQTRH